MIPIGETQDGRADMTNFEMDLFDTRISSYALEKEESEQCCQHSIIKPACIPISIISLFIFLVVFFPLFNEDGFDTTTTRYVRSGYCTDQCRVQLSESLPSDLIFKNDSTRNPSTYEMWKRLLDEAQVSIDVASFYWNLRENTTVYPTSWQGGDVFKRFVKAAERGVRNQPTATFPQRDSEYLANHGYATVRNLNMLKLIGEDGVLHTKFWIVDSRHVYIGSANMDWKSLTEVKELGFVIWNCTCIGNDLSKIFNVYWRLGVSGAKIPYKWPLNLRTYFNFTHPLKLSNSKDDAAVFISSSPRQFLTRGREEDGDAIVTVMNDAQQFVHVSVMDYIPATIYRTTNNTYWSKLDDAMRAAAYRGVHIRLLVSYWKYSKPEMISFLKSLVEINDGLPRSGNQSGKIEVKLFLIPVNPQDREIPHTRVNHNKYMVTERIAYVGTSNWVGDYFMGTAGVGISFISPNLVNSLNEVFMRDWTSTYTKSIGEFMLKN